MNVVVGIDLGSTTSKALILDETGAIAGKGITNSRSNYDVAVDVARTEAVIQARFSVLRARLAAIFGDGLEGLVDKLTGALSTEFRVTQYLSQLESLTQELASAVEEVKDDGLRRECAEAVASIVEGMNRGARRHFRFGACGSSFFRDLATSDYMAASQKTAQQGGPSFERLANFFDKSIIVVENRGIDLSFEKNIRRPFEVSLDRFASELEPFVERLLGALQSVIEEPLQIINSVGTGYGRATLPFPKGQIRSEILCHGLGAHRMYPGTRTVLDIGGQDTKAIQVEQSGIVTSFQMNDRCAAGCGRYLGYIADEMGLGLHDLGPLANSACHPVKINSTCTVFAGAELRDRLTMGQKREDILAGLHRAIILRAMSLLARSGGIEDEFTFTGGVANNSAAVHALEELVQENYGARTINLSTDSIFAGSLGAATFAYRDSFGQELAA